MQNICVVFDHRRTNRPAVYFPSREILNRMRCGGLFDGMPFDTLNRQVELMMQGGVSEDAAVNYIKAVHFGGVLDPRQAIDILIARDVLPQGDNPHVMDAFDLPPRWPFRNAWRRGANGGPPYIDMAEARIIQFGRIVDAVERSNTLKARLSLFGLRKRVRVDTNLIIDRLSRAQTPDELIDIMPLEVRQ